MAPSIHPSCTASTSRSAPRSKPSIPKGHCHRPEACLRKTTQAGLMKHCPSAESIMAKRSKTGQTRCDSCGKFHALNLSNNIKTAKRSSDSKMTRDTTKAGTIKHSSSAQSIRAKRKNRSKSRKRPLVKKHNCQSTESTTARRDKKHGTNQAHHSKRGTPRKGRKVKGKGDQSRLQQRSCCQRFCDECCSPCCSRNCTII